MPEPPGSRIGQFVDRVEETLIAVFLGLMTAITFANVIARYVFNDNLLWALEATVFLFAWMVLLGASYAVKRSLHLGIDLLISVLPPAPRRVLGLVSVAACLAFSILLLIGSWDYWYPFATKRAFLEVNDVPMPQFLQFLADWFNEGEAYEKDARSSPMRPELEWRLLTGRFVQAGVAIAAAQVMVSPRTAEERCTTLRRPTAGG